MSSNVLPQVQLTDPENGVLPERPTLWTAAANVLQSHEEGPPLRRVPRELPAPLSFAQERLWFLDCASPGSAAYHIAFAWRIRGAFNIRAFETALNRIVQRHTIFQTRYQQADGRPMQVADVTVPVVVTTHLQWMNETAAEPFDLTAPPLIRANVLVCGDDQCFLTLVVHHIVFDGWSRGIFLRELNAEYAAAVGGGSAIIRESAVQYIDYAVWHRQWMEGGVLSRQMAYWRRQLAPPLATLDLPTDRPRSSAGKGAGAALFFSLPQTLYDGVERLRKEHVTTRFVVLLAAFKALLHRYTGQDDIVVGSVAANRNRPEVRNVIGCFVNTLVLRTRLNPELTFRELLLRVEETARGAFANQEVPFERLVGELKPERAPHRSPLFQVMFALQNTGQAELRLAGTRSRSIPVHNGCSKFDLSVELSEQPGRLRACIEYNTGLFDRATIHRMTRHFAVLLAGAIRDPDSRLGDLPLLDRAEEQQLVTGCNNSTTSYPRYLSVPALFCTVARRQPDAIALEDGAGRWTYAGLDARSEAIACALQRLGVGRGTLVAIVATRGPDTIAAMLGILKAGGAYVPIDPAAPPERIRFMFEDSAAAAIVAEKGLLQKLPRTSTPVLCLDDVGVTAEKCACEDCGPDDPAYVLYTSGSTGKPKGVCVPHRAIVRLVRNTNYITLGDDDVVAQAASLSFDAATFEVWGALLNGARLTILPQDVVLDPAQLAGAIRSCHITTLFLTTSLFNLVAAQAPRAFRPLRTMLFGGEVADVDAVRAVLEQGAPRRLLNVYGPTETTTFATWHVVESVAPDATSIPIGQPISNTEVHLLDPAGHLVPFGVRGEIYIGGDGVALGYLRRPELSAEKFVEAEISSSVPRRQKLYRTGDFGVRRADGAVEFLGRMDDQAKIRGFRVEPSEIEIVLRQHPAVADCCVVVRKSPSTGQQLAAYVVLAREHSIGGRDLRFWLEARLPEYMVPAMFAFLPHLPLNANGKVDRAALPQPDAAVVDNTVIKPWMPLHLQLLAIWEQLLDVKPLSLSDDFFDLGGHSLLAVRLMDRIEQVCGRRLPVSTLFECSTIEKLAGAILRSDPAPHPIVEVQPGGSGTPFFFLHGDLSGGGLYCRQLASQLGPAQPFYALPPQPVAPGAPLLSIEAMAAEHLRTVRMRRPHGPYVLGGFCVSALVALELARQLANCGERVELLVMLDPPRPGALSWLRRCIELAATVDGRDEPAQVAHFYHRFSQVFRVRELWSQGALQKLKWLGNRLRRKPASAPTQESASSDAAAAYLWATAAFQPRRYALPTALICCDAVMGSASGRLHRWRRFLPDLEEHIVDCAHLELVTTRSAETAALIHAALASAERPPCNSMVRERPGHLNEAHAATAPSLALARVTCLDGPRTAPLSLTPSARNGAMP